MGSTHNTKCGARIQESEVRIMVSASRMDIIFLFFVCGADVSGQNVLRQNPSGLWE